jgi:hypothetical protein
MFAGIMSQSVKQTVKAHFGMAVPGHPSPSWKLTAIRIFAEGAFESRNQKVEANSKRYKYASVEK